MKVILINHDKVVIGEVDMKVNFNNYTPVSHVGLCSVIKSANQVSIGKEFDRLIELDEYIDADEDTLWRTAEENVGDRILNNISKLNPNDSYYTTTSIDKDFFNKQSPIYPLTDGMIGYISVFYKA